MKSPSYDHDISVVVTAHSEGILAHKTILSIRRAIDHLPKNVRTEIILHADNPTAPMEEYLRTNKEFLEGVAIYRNAFGDLGSSRNFAVSKATGRYVAFIDADDIMSSNWLRSAYEKLESEPYGEFVAHSELTIEFGGADSVILKHGEINQATDALLTTFANRWNSVIFAPKDLLVRFPFEKNSPGYGYEDWNLNCRLIHAGIHNVLIPETAIFVRRKLENSEWSRQISSYSVLRSNPLLSFGFIRTIPPDTLAPAADAKALNTPHLLKRTAKRLVVRYPRLRTVAHHLRSLKNQASAPNPSALPEWLIKEWKSLHAIEKQLFPSDERLRNLAVYDSLTPEHYQTGTLYRAAVGHLRFDAYDYVFFAPWLMKGGADSFTINYANTIQELRPDYRILIITTLDQPALWTERLNESIDLLPLGNIARDAALAVTNRLLEQIIENSGASILHIINSEAGYDFVRNHAAYIRGSQKRLVVTSFSQSTDDSTRVFGYSHTHVPYTYELTDLITTDNQTVRSMWSDDYGFDSSKIAVHRQPLDVGPLPSHDTAGQDRPLRVLWAARVAPEKLPHLVGRIGDRVNKQGIQIDMYGTPDPAYDTSFLDSMPPNVHYKGSFDGFFSLPLGDYDAYLYTSLFDGMPNALLEAGLAGLPVVSSKVGGIPELIQSGSTGLLVDDPRSADEYANAIMKLAADPALRDTLRSGLHATLKKEYSRERYVKSVETMLESLEKGRGQ